MMVSTATTELDQLQPAPSPDVPPPTTYLPYSGCMPDDLGSQELIDGYDVQNNIELYNITNQDWIKKLDIVQKQQKEKACVDWGDGQTQPYPLGHMNNSPGINTTDRQEVLCRGEKTGRQSSLRVEETKHSIWHKEPAAISYHPV